MPSTHNSRRILTARRSTPLITDDLLLATAAMFACQPPRAGPLADVLAGALATPLLRTGLSSLATEELHRVSDSFKLPTFWPKELVIYFLQIEVLFDQHYITGSVLQYRCLVLALSLEVVTPNHCFLQTITAATPNPYELLMTRLLQTSAPTDTALLSQLLAAMELGDWRRTDMMNTMLSQLPPDEPAGNLFLALYLQWLPASLREGVAAKHFTDPQQLAEYADTLWEAQPRLPITAAVLSGAPPHPAVSPCHSRSRASSSSQPCSDGLLPCSNCLSPRSRFSPSLQPPSQMASAPAAYICYYHEWFEAAACNYRPSCAWLENSGAGGGN